MEQGCVPRLCKPLSTSSWWAWNVSREAPRSESFWAAPLQPREAGKQNFRASLPRWHERLSLELSLELIQFVTETNNCWAGDKKKVSLACLEHLFNRQDTKVSVLLSLIFKFFRQTGRVLIKDWEQPHSLYHGGLNIGCWGPFRQEFVTSSAKAITLKYGVWGRGVSALPPSSLPHGSV